jgi:dUTP pyrophosphatase
MKLLVKKLDEKAIIPTKKRDTDEGYDIYSIEPKRLFKGTTTLIHTGISAMVLSDFEYFSKTNTWPVSGSNTQLEERQYWLQIEGRSGMASKGVFPSGGIVDYGYTGEIAVMLVNCSSSDYYIKPGDKIAQLIPRLHLNPEVVEVDSLGETDRGEKGFGSSGT